MWRYTWYCTPHHCLYLLCRWWQPPRKCWSNYHRFFSRSTQLFKLLLPANHLLRLHIVSPHMQLGYHPNSCGVSKTIVRRLVFFAQHWTRTSVYLHAVYAPYYSKPAGRRMLLTNTLAIKAILFLSIWCVFRLKKIYICIYICDSDRDIIYCIQPLLHRTAYIYNTRLLQCSISACSIYHLIMFINYRKCMLALLQYMHRLYIKCINSFWCTGLSCYSLLFDYTVDRTLCCTPQYDGRVRWLLLHSS